MTSECFITAREIFLTQHWLRYPAATAFLQIPGVRFERIVRLDTQSEAATAVLSGGAQIDDLARWTWMGESLLSLAAQDGVPLVCEVVDTGDWIAWNPATKQVGLLAPDQSQRAPRQPSLQSLRQPRELELRAVQWSRFLREVREFFWGLGFFEISTPTLAPSPGTEPFLDPLGVSYEFGSEKRTRYLITSPEFHLKRVLVSGVPKIFEIAKCFRNREGGTHHRVEFHMLEWYRAFSDLSEIANDVERLIGTLASAPSRSLVRTTVPELFQRYVGFHLRPQSSADDLRAECRRHEIHTDPSDDFNDLFHRLWLERIENRLQLDFSDAPVLVSEYPQSLAALARLGESGFADRFEIYWRGFELCNAFHELNDPRENRLRFERDLQEKRRLGKDPVPLDDELLTALESGMPPAGGIALGLERFYMALHGLSDIGQVGPFSSMV